MANLYLSVKGQTLTVKSDIDRIVENSINYLKINIDTSKDPEWNGLTVKCIISKGKQDAAFSDKNHITKDFLKAPGFVVHLVGYSVNKDGNYEKLIPTNPVIVTIHPTGVLNAEDEPGKEIEVGWADKILGSFDQKYAQISSDLSNIIDTKMAGIKKEQDLFITNTDTKILEIQKVANNSYEYAFSADNKADKLIEAVGTQTKDEVLVYDINTEEAVYEYQVIDGIYSVIYQKFNPMGSSSLGRSTEKISVQTNEVYTVSAICTGSWGLMALFDENEELIIVRGLNEIKEEENYTDSKGNFTLQNPYVYTVPETEINNNGEEKKVCYIVFSTADKTTFPLQVIGPVTSFKNIDENIEVKIEPIKENILTIKKDINIIENETQDMSNAIGKTIYLQDITKELVFETGCITASSGNFVSTENGKRTTKFKVSAGEVYHIWGKYSTALCLIAWYDNKQNFISSIYVIDTTNGVTAIAENEIYTVPEIIVDAEGNERTVAYMACATTLQKDNPLMIKKEMMKYNNVKENISNAVEDSSVTKLNKILISPNGSEWVLVVSDDGVLKAVKLRNYGDDVNTSLTLPIDLEVGTYTLKYENVDGVLNDYKDICSLTVTEDEIPSYNGLIAENCAPEETTVIGVYDSSNTRVGEINLGFLESKYSDKLYTFAAISDSHIGVSDGEEDFTNAIDYFESENEVEFITICGDMVNDSSVVEQLETYQRIAKGASKPIYVVTGNHEALNYAEGDDFDSIKGYFAQDKYPNINQELYYSFTYNNDVFIMMGVYSFPQYNQVFTLQQLQWLQETLERNRNRRCFLFSHYYPINGSGDALGLYNSDGYVKSIGQSFLSLLKHYKNVIFFHGHTHAAFEVQEYNAMNTIDKIYGKYSIHIPSLTWPRVPNATMTEYDKKGAEGQGYLIDVYENGIALIGRDFEKGEFVPIGTYYLDTITQTIEANSFKDPTGILTTPVY